MENDNNMICKSVSENQRGNIWLSNHLGSITTRGGEARARLSLHTVFSAKAAVNGYTI